MDELCLSCRHCANCTVGLRLHAACLLALSGVSRRLLAATPAQRGSRQTCSLADSSGI